MTETPTLRLDVWLWRARFFKTRALSGAHIRKRGIRLTRNGQTRRVNKPGATIAVADIVTMALGGHIKAVEVLEQARIALAHAEAPAALANCVRVMAIAAQHAGDDGSQPANHDILGIDDVPFRLNVAGLGGIGFHR